MNASPMPPEPTAWWLHALFGGTMPVMLAIAVSCALGLILVSRAWWRVHHPRRFARETGIGEAGTATLEFALVFPVLLLLTLVLLQTTLVMVGNFFVHYAAFAATRAAIVQIPSDQGTPRNVIHISAGSPKYDAIRSAAIIAVMPICGHAPEGVVNSAPFVQGLREHYAAYAPPTPRWVDTQAGQRLNYAAAHTHVTLYYARGWNQPGDRVTFELLPMDSLMTFGQSDPITVRVVHRLNLSIPYARALFADGQHDQHGEGAYADVTAQYTLTNEGWNPDLPPQPSLPRVRIRR